MVREERLELSRRKTLEPKSSASTNSATLAYTFNPHCLFDKIYVFLNTDPKKEDGEFYPNKTSTNKRLRVFLLFIKFKSRLCFQQFS